MSSITNAKIYKQDRQIILQQVADRFGVYEWSPKNDNLSDTLVAFDKATQLKKDKFNASSKESAIQLDHQTSCLIYGFYEYFRLTTRTNTSQFDSKNQEKTPFNLTVSNQVLPEMQRKYKIEPHELPQSSETRLYFQTTTTLKPMAEEFIYGINWCKIPHNLGFNHNESGGIKLKICQRRWMASCIKSIQNKDLPVLPIIVRDDMNHWMEWIKIIYIESHNVFSGVQFGYDRDDLLLIAAWLRVEGGCGLPTDLKDLIMRFYGTLKIKSICMDPQYVYCMHREIRVRQIAECQMKEIYDRKWVKSIDICDISSKLEQMAVKYGFELNVVKQCFNDHEIDYLYLQNHTRADFVGLLRSYGIKIGKAIKIYGVLREDFVDGGEEEYSKQASILRHILG